METKKQYSTPELTVVTFKTEQGYASSIDIHSSVLSLFCSQEESDYNSQAQENWHEESSFFGSW